MPFYCQQREKVLGDRGDGPGCALRCAMSTMYNIIRAVDETYYHVFRKQWMLDVLLQAVKGGLSSRRRKRIFSLRCTFVPVVTTLSIA